MDEPERKPTELGSDMETSCEVCGCTAPCGTWYDGKSESHMRLCLGCAIELGLMDDTGKVEFNVPTFDYNIVYSLGDRVLYNGEILELRHDGFCRLTDNTVVNIPVNGKLSNEQGGQHAVRNKET